MRPNIEISWFERFLKKFKKPKKSQAIIQLSNIQSNQSQEESEIELITENLDPDFMLPGETPEQILEFRQKYAEIIKKGTY